ncbi:MAG: hypothetical protein AB1489_39530, partial [Acidobacteriota bacterium]
MRSTGEVCSSDNGSGNKSEVACFPINTYKFFKRFTIVPDFLDKIAGMTMELRKFYAEVQKKVSLTKTGYGEIKREELCNRLKVSSVRTIDSYNRFMRKNGLMQIDRTGRGNRYALLYHPAMEIDLDQAHKREIKLPQSVNRQASAHQKGNGLPSTHDHSDDHDLRESFKEEEHAGGNQSPNSSNSSDQGDQGDRTDQPDQENGSNHQNQQRDRATVTSSDIDVEAEII